MPTYTYGCEKCGEGFEVVQRITDDPLRVHSEAVPETACPGRIDRKISGPGVFLLRGKGWYRDGY